MDRMRVDSITFDDELGTVLIDEILSNNLHINGNSVKQNKHSEHKYRVVKHKDNTYELFEKVRLQNGLDVEYQRYYTDFCVMYIEDADDKTTIATYYEVTGVTIDEEYVSIDKLTENVKEKSDFCERYEEYTSDELLERCGGYDCYDCEACLRDHSIISDYKGLLVERVQDSNILVITVNK